MKKIILILVVLFNVSICYTQIYRSGMSLEEGYLLKCDSIWGADKNFFTAGERDSTKKMIIEYISIQTDEAIIGYEISVKKLTAPTSTKIAFKNERLIGNVTVNFNLVGTPLILQPGEHLFTKKTLTDDEGSSKVWLTVKYRLR